MVLPRGSKGKSVKVSACAGASARFGTEMCAEPSSLVNESFLLGSMPFGTANVVGLIVEETIRDINSTRQGRAGILYWLSLVLG